MKAQTVDGKPFWGDEKFEIGIKVAGLGLGQVDYVADTITLDDRAAEIFGLTANIAIPRDTLHHVIHTDDRLSIDAQVNNLLDPDKDNFIDVEHRVVHGNGTIRWVSARKLIRFSPDEDGTPRPQSGIVALIDITEHKEDQQRIRELLQELNHRSKNLLTVVQSIANRTFATGDVDTFRERFSDRIRGLVQNTDALAHVSWTNIGLDALVQSHLRAFVDVDADRVSVEGPEIRIRPNHAQAIGMALHELGTNALKYGAWSGAVGKVSIAWVYDAENALVLRWEESGGPAVVPPSKKGFGQTVMKDMAAMAVDGDVVLEFRPSGVFWQLTMPSETLV